MRRLHRPTASIAVLWRNSLIGPRAGVLSVIAWLQQLPLGTSDEAALSRYCKFAYSAFACFRMGMSGSASFQRAKKSW